MPTRQQKLGKWGESLAAEYLNARGYEILDRNVHTRYGELDLVTCQKGFVVFVEVKTRTSMRYGYPEAAITPKKREHLLAAANYYLMEHPSLGGDWRIDVVSILMRQDLPPEIIHFENAVA